MKKSIGLALVAAFLATGYAEARNGSGWHGHSGRRGGNKQSPSGEYNFFLKPENQPGRWDCGPGLLFPTQACRPR